MENTTPSAAPIKISDPFHGAKPINANVDWNQYINYFDKDTTGKTGEFNCRDPAANEDSLVDRSVITSYADQGSRERIYQNCYDTDHEYTRISIALTKVCPNSKTLYYADQT